MSDEERLRQAAMAAKCLRDIGVREVFELTSNARLVIKTATSPNPSTRALPAQQPQTGRRIKT
jgi:hypothetical protein